MRFFVLLQILPSDLVHYISQIIMRDEAANIIRKKFLFNRYICDSISDIIYFSVCNNKGLDITQDIVDCFKTVIHNNIPKKYNQQFWEHVLNITSRKLYEYYNYICLHSNNKNNNDNYKNLKIIIKLWLNICKKFDININCREYFNSRSVGAKSNFTYVIKAKRILKLTNYSKHLYPPTVVNQQGDMLGYYENMVHISQFTNR